MTILLDGAPVVAQAGETVAAVDHYVPGRQLKAGRVVIGSDGGGVVGIEIGDAAAVVQPRVRDRGEVHVPGIAWGDGVLQVHAEGVELSWVVGGSTGEE